MTNGDPSPGHDVAQSGEPVLRIERLFRHILVGGACGAVLGAIVLRFFFSFDTWFCAALGAVFGVIAGVPLGLRGDVRRLRRASEQREAALEAEVRSGAAPPAGLDEKLRKVFASNVQAVRKAVQVEVNGTGLAVADVSHAGPGDSNSVHETVAYYEPEGLRLPTFALHPKGRYTDFIARAPGRVDIDFPSHPVFSGAYELSAAVEEDVRLLFDDRVVAELGARPGFHVESVGEGLAMFLPEQRLAGRELQALLGEACRIFRLLEGSARAAGFTKARVPPKRDVKALYEKLPGEAGIEARKVLVTRADAEAFARQPPPRRVPKNIAHYVERYSPLLFTGMGVAFALAGAFFGSLYVKEALFTAIGFLNTSLFAGVFGLLFVAAGSTMTFFFGRRRYRIGRLLRGGRAASARIEKVETTDESVNGVELALLTVAYRHEGREVRVSCKVVGPGKERAERLLAGRRPAAILYDPAVPKRILFVDDLISVGTELEP